MRELTDWLAARRRMLNGLGAGACAGMIAYALYAQHVLGLEPCPLCIFQRVAVILTGLVFLAAALHHPRSRFRYVYGVLGVLTTVGGIAVSARHVWLQNLPPDAVPACGPGLNYLLQTLPLSDVLSQVFTGYGECATINWHFLGLTMPAWTLIAQVGLLLLIAGANFSSRSSVESREAARSAPVGT